MAGIGFELKKALHQKKTLSQYLSFFLYSTFTCVGPWLLSILTLTLLMIIAHYFVPSKEEREIFVATSGYSFIMAQLILGYFLFPITRYISDKLYVDKPSDIGSAYFGSFIIVEVIGLCIGILFYWKAPFIMEFKIMAVILIMVIIAVWHQFIFVSGVKNYKNIAIGYAMGNGVAIVLSVILLTHPIKFADTEMALNLIIAYSVGFSVTFIILYITIINTFPLGKSHIFKVCYYFFHHKVLGLTSLFISLVTWCPLILIWWLSPLSIKVGDFFTINPIYDVSYFFSVLTIMPSIVYFTIMMETQFYEKYKIYFSLIAKNGQLEQIHNARKDMVRTLYFHMLNLVEIQLFFSIVIIIFAKTIFYALGLPIIAVDIFRELTLGGICFSTVSILSLILQYFEFRAVVCKIWIVFFVVVVGLTLFFLRGDFIFIGYAYLIASGIILVLTLFITRRYVRDVDFYTFYFQPFYAKEKMGRIEQFFDRLKDTK